MMFGLNIGAEWKGIDFSMLWQGAALFDVNLCGMYANVGYDNTFYTKPFYCDGNTPYYLVENSWRPDNPDAEYPRLGIVSRDNGGKMSCNNNFARKHTVWVEDYILEHSEIISSAVKNGELYIAKCHFDHHTGEVYLIDRDVNRI